MIHFQSESPCLNNVNFGWESLVAQRVEKQIKLEVGEDAVLSQMASQVPGGHCTLCLSFYSIFSESELHCAFLLGTTLTLCVFQWEESCTV